MKNKVYVLNPDYLFKNDINRIVVRSILNYDPQLSKPFRGFIHPVQAMIFSFFSYKRTLGENINLLSSFLDMPQEDVLKMIEPFIENEQTAVTLFKGLQIRFPKNLIVDITKINTDYIPLEIKLDEMKCEGLDLQSKRMNRGPSQMTFMLTNKCVTKCCYCYANTDKKVEKYIPTKRIIDIIREAKNLNFYNLNLIGGEVFLHKDWDIILGEMVANGFSPVSISTKVPLTDIIIDKLISTNYKGVLQLSIDSIDSESIQKSLCVNSTYVDDVKRGIQLLEKRHIRFQVETVITKYKIQCLHRKNKKLI